MQSATEWKQRKTAPRHATSLSPAEASSVKSGLRMARVLSLDAFWKQAFATALSPACKCRATALGLHPGTKTVLTFACSLGGLISSFHKIRKASAGLRAVTLEMGMGLSIGRLRSRCDSLVSGIARAADF